MLKSHLPLFKFLLTGEVMMKQMRTKLFGFILMIIVFCIPISVEATNYRVGDKIEFGQKNGQVLIWDVIHVDSDGNPLLFSNEILDWKAFDSTDQETGDERRETGSNRWADSSIRQWLNSSEQVISWKTGIPRADAVIPSHLAYDYEAGFLATTFSEGERSAILEVTRDVIIDEEDKQFRHSGEEAPYYVNDEHGRDVLLNSDLAYRERVTDRMFILSIDEIERYVFQHQDLLVGKVAKQIKNESYREMHSDSYWIVGPDRQGTTNLSIEQNESYAANYPKEGLGVRPAFYLNKSKWKPQFGDGSESMPYAEVETKVHFKKKTMNLYVGNGSTIDYEIEPSYRKIALKWSSDNPHIASVNGNGIVMAHRIGKTTIRLTTATGQQQSIQVEVKTGTFKPKVKTFTVLKSKNLYGGTVDLEDYYLSPFDNKSGGTAILKDNHQQTHVVYETENDVRLIVYDRFLKVKKRITFKKEWVMFGDITLDPFGNYYILWGTYLDEQDHRSSSIMITKYNLDGKRMNSISWNGKELDTKIAFDGGNARIIYQNDMLIAHFARRMFAHEDGFNHQASQVVYADAKTMTPMTYQKPYVSHSFDQQILPLKNGNTVFVDQGDGHSRGFEINHLVDSELIEFTPFHFREGEDRAYGYNYTFSQLGGIAEGRGGYALLGASEKTLSASPAMSNRNESRNLFLQFFETDVSSYLETSNIDDLFLVKGEMRKIVGKQPMTGPGRYFLDADTLDKNVKWVTNYKGTLDAAYPKIISTDDGRYIVMWEEFNDSQFSRTKLQIFSTFGDELTKIIDVPKARLPMDEDVIYRNGALYWTTITNDYYTDDYDKWNSLIQLHRLKID